MGEAEREAVRGENRIVFEDEIKARPKRTWFESEMQKKEAREVGARELNGPGNGKGKGKGKLSAKAKKKLDDHRERVEGRIWKKGKESMAGPNGKKERKGRAGKRDQTPKPKTNAKRKPNPGGPAAGKNPRK